MKMEMTAKDEGNYRRFALTLLVWMVCFSAATIVLRGKWIDFRILQYAIALVPSILGVATVAMYLRFLRNADELVRKIHVEALGWGFGAGILFMMGYRLLERVGVPELDINDPMLAMMLFWMLGLWTGTRRYA